jgi:hypothetical protein
MEVGPVERHPCKFGKPDAIRGRCMNGAVRLVRFNYHPPSPEFSLVCMARRQLD